VFQAAVKAVETVDACLARVMESLQRVGGTMLVTADHGNVEQLFDYDTNQPHTAHTLNKVPALLFNPPDGVVSLADGRLADVAPTLLALMGLKQPSEMTGHSLLRDTVREHVLTVPAAMRNEAARKVA
jgi:2,3-bisphosphoglycerate-independent phosphoglycerate mutase